ncbi:ArnT family glycosyltransferase [Zunongwangia sp.]|uniref:ArnT family glycosyltransferase n=1 Tax=Zunongwangia sp. TaxID=1965325 RepID=UPI003AA889FA
MKHTPHRYIWVLTAVCILIFFFNLDAIYVNIMEARNFVTAREMFTSNHWILTTLNDLPRYEKPPLPTWLTAFSAEIFGQNTLWAFRLPAALAATLLTISLYNFAKCLEITRKQSFIASLILTSSFYIIFSGRNGQWDIFTHAFMMVTIYFLFLFFKNSHQFYRNAIMAALFLGFSILSKGPVSLYALFLPFLIAFFIVYKTNSFKKKWFALAIFIFLSLAIGSSWFIYVRMADPVAFLDITTDEASNWGSYNVRPFYYYWSFFTQSGIWTIPSFVALLYPYLKNKVSNKKAYQFSLLWTLLSVILLSIIPEKKSRYLLPVLIPMALNTSFYIEYLGSHFSALKIKEKWVVYFNFGLIACIGFAFTIAAPFFLNLEGEHYIWYILTSIALCVLGIGILYFLKQQKITRVFYLTVAFTAAIIVFAFPLIDTLLDNPNFKSFATLQNVANKKNFKVYEYDSFSPEIVWDYGKPLPLLLYKDSLSIPKDEKFGLLHEITEDFPTNRFKNYEVKKIDRYDLNQVNPDKSGYKERLIRDFYILKKKN